MTENHDFETALKEGMEQASLPVVATPELQSRIAAAAKSAPVRRWWRLRHLNLTLRLVPVVATVLMVLAVGAVAVVVGNRSDHAPVAATEPPPSTSSSTTPTASPTPTPTPTPSPTSTPTSSSSSGSIEASGSRSPTTASSSSPVVGPTAPAGCSTPSGGTLTPQTQQEFESHIVGTWLVCSTPSFFGTTEAGLQIDGDGNWAKLTRDAAGRLVRSDGDRDAGTWSVVETSSMNGRPAFQINFAISAIGRTAIASPVVFAQAVTRMHLSNTGVYAADYVATSEHVSTAAPSSPNPSSTTPTALAACSVPAGGAVRPTSEQDAAQRLTRDWLACSHPTFFGGTEDGLRIAGDGSWALLNRNAAGNLVTSTKPLEHGTWTLIDVSAANGAPTWQINFVYAGNGGTVITIPAFAKAVTRIYLDNMGISAANYVPAQ